MSADGSLPQERRLHALIGSRICHDLISPLGAIGNGIELLAMSEAGAAPEISLITESVQNASARIRFFRVAFGAASPESTVSVQEIREVLSDLTRSSRTRMEWAPDHDLCRPRVKLAYLLILCLENALAYGGTIRVIETGGGWELIGEGKRLIINDNLWKMMLDAGGDLDIQPATVHFALIGEAARSAGCRIETELSDGRITIRI